MTDCFQPCELQYRTTYQAIQEMNLCRVGYLIVTKSALPSSPEYLAILDKDLAHIQITVTCLDDERTAQYEKASPPVNAFVRSKLCKRQAMMRRFG